MQARGVQSVAQGPPLPRARPLERVHVPLEVLQPVVHLEGGLLGLGGGLQQLVHLPRYGLGGCKRGQSLPKARTRTPFALVRKDKLYQTIVNGN